MVNRSEIPREKSEISSSENSRVFPNFARFFQKSHKKRTEKRKKRTKTHENAQRADFARIFGKRTNFLTNFAAGKTKFDQNSAEKTKDPLKLAASDE